MAGVILITIKHQLQILFSYRHAMLAVGYSDQSRSFIVRNSWGQIWVIKTFLFLHRLIVHFREKRDIVIFPTII